ncbi:kinase-like domain-containing protein [Nemania sp. NC0429]|nr:kinase-like domain-containing protein [Nemania sp. NC0429]
MYEDNVFAVLTAYDRGGYASRAFQLPENRRWLKEKSEPRGVDRLVITFDVKSPLHGIQFGRDPSSSDVFLGPQLAVSRSHYNIIVDEDLCIWLEDLHSTWGTAVGCSGQNQTNKRRWETWILAGPPGNGNPFGEITIHTDPLVVRIEFPNHAAASAKYVENLRAFSRECCNGLARRSRKRGDEMRDTLRLENDDRGRRFAAPVAMSLKDRPVYYRHKVIGHGRFGSVSGVIRMRDGKYFAAKTFRPQVQGTYGDPEPSKKDGNTELWWVLELRRAFTIMKDNSHPNLMRVFDFHETPLPYMMMDYYPEGSLENTGILDDKDIITAFGQILDALRHLHAKGLIHGNLKPANILVETRPLFKVVVTDFGFQPHITPAGFWDHTLHMSQPVYQEISRGGSPKTDMWLLGVMILDLMDLPPKLPLPAITPLTDVEAPQEFWQRWNHTDEFALQDRLEEEEDGSFARVLKGIFETDTGKRWDADRCLRYGFKNGLFRRRMADGLVECATDEDDLVQAMRREDRTRMLTEAPPRRGSWASSISDTSSMSSNT